MVPARGVSREITSAGGALSFRVNPFCANESLLGWRYLFGCRFEQVVLFQNGLKK